MSRISAEQKVPDTRSLEADVTVILASLGHLLVTARWSSVVPSIVDVTERDPEFADIHGKIQRGHAAPLREVIERAAVRGELSATAEPSSMVSALIGRSTIADGSHVSRSMIISSRRSPGT